MSARDLDLEHGGDPRRIADRLGLPEDGETDWLDLSTGINPHAYGLAQPPASAWAALPTADEMARLLEAARSCYRVPGSAGICAGPGSQSIIQVLPDLLKAKRVTICTPSYVGHESAWRRAGFDPAPCDDPMAPAGRGEVRILVNPNNPDGRTLASGQVREVAQRLQDADGWLIVDEAFADLDPAVSAAGEADCGNLVLLRSFGKFFGLAGLRLGFAVSTPPIAEEIAARLGPWPVSGPAIHVAVPALEDGSWQQEMRAKLHREAAALDEIMVKSGLAIVGGTALFRLVSHDKAGDNFERLLRERIFVRRFPDHPDWLRIGLPGSEQALRRFAGALRNAV